MKESKKYEKIHQKLTFDHRFVAKTVPIQYTETEVMSMNVQKVGILIAELRKEKGMTQKDLAVKLRVSDRAVSKWERGLNLPNAELFEPLCALLDISVMELLRGERNEAKQIAVAEAEDAVSAIAELAKIRERRTRRLRFCIVLLVCALLACGVFFVREYREKSEIQEMYDSEHAFPTVTISNFDYNGKTEILNSYPAGFYFPDAPYDRELAMSSLAINYSADTTKWIYNQIMSVRDLELDVMGEVFHSICFSVGRAKSEMEIYVYRWPISLQGCGVTFEDAEEITYEEDRYHGEEWTFDVEPGYVYSVVVFWGENNEYFVEYAFRTVSVTGERP